MLKNTASQKIAVFAFDTTTGAPKTGDSANISVYLSKDWGAVTQLTDTTATEMDSTNAKGWYLFDVSQTETNADTLHFTGKSSTANISVVGNTIYTRAPNSNLLSIDANGRVDAIKIAGTTQSAVDIAARIGAPVGASISADIAGVQADTDNIQTRIPAALVSGRIDASVGAMAADVLTSTALAASAVTEIQTGLSTLDAAGVRTAVGLAAANLDTQLTAIDDYIDTEVAAIKAKTDQLTFTVAGQVDSNIQYVNDVLVNGTGAPGNEWGP